MFNKSEESIRNSLLDMVPSNIPKFEGTFIYDVISPLSCELSILYSNLQRVSDKMFLKNLDSVELEERGKEYGITRKLGKKAKGKVRFYGNSTGGKHPVGIAVQTDDEYKGYIYKTVEEFEIDDEIGYTDVSVEAEHIGEKYNVEAKSLSILPIKEKGITSVSNLESISGGSDCESDDALRRRILFKLQNPATSGNITHYKEWALEMTTVGDARVYALGEVKNTEEGNATSDSDLETRGLIIGETTINVGEVLIVVISPDMNPIRSDESIGEIKKHIDNKRPIGVKTIVKSAKEIPVEITGTISLSDGAIMEDAIENFVVKLEEYRKKIAFTKGEISLAMIGAFLVSLPQVMDYEQLRINGSDVNKGIEEYEVPVFTINLHAKNNV
ncbi:baseplate J/gp47 family protein [Oceanirhabdus sp. W0125-5]|uniref:baseplate J/gp47 family protein n=1 Tax=Oceanirhabdus sp. W0125-5 TaxID=2999116 RepID=UPI0022F31BA5|nr:baseplate J/gp47 family protein [Oceanirhabdus sp. W0125-5]WBW96043.1 baseplate J/gp47 family protein [Oceanirhabdus sp. W0125-5]